MSYEYIEMQKLGLSASGKTEVWAVMTKRDRTVELGQIAWFGRWRQYTFFPHGDAVFSAGCLEDVAHFITVLHDRRKKAGKATAWGPCADGYCASQPACPEGECKRAPVCSIPDCGCTGLEHP